MLSQGSIWPVACRVALPLALVSALVALAAAAAPAGARTAAFRPIEVNRHVVVFRVHGVKPDRILGAEAKLRRKHAVDAADAGSASTACVLRPITGDCSRSAPRSAFVAASSG